MLGITDHFLRYEFQMRGTIHVHGLLWIESPPDFNNLKRDIIKYENLQDDFNRFMDD